MTPAVIAFLVVNAIALLALPRRWAPLPLLVGACYMTRAQAIDLGPLTFTVLRILVAVGLVRLVIRREWLAGRLNAADRLMLAWAAWMVVSVAFHDDPATRVFVRLRNVFDGCGAYFLFRVFCRTWDELERFSTILAIVLVPIGFAMLVEKAAGYNLFAAFGGVPELPSIRNGVVRARGAFASPILAGTIGAVSLPFIIGLWPRRHWISAAGIVTCVTMVVASGSSGPILSLAAGVGALALWPVRERLRPMRWAALLAYIALDLVMRQPGYYIIARIDLTGGSTGWHRARLIESSMIHLEEWWLVGTDYTRHWMPTGLRVNPEHTDLTNHYLVMGVNGGLLLLVLFVAILVKGFASVGEGVRGNLPSHARFIVWATGASLFAHAATGMSVSYFDHSVLFLYLTLAAAAACGTAAGDGLPLSSPDPARSRRVKASSWRWMPAGVDAGTMLPRTDPRNQRRPERPRRQPVAGWAFQARPTRDRT